MSLSKERQQEIDDVIKTKLILIDKSYPENNILEIVKEFGIKVYVTCFSEIDGMTGVCGVINNETAEIYLNKEHSKVRNTFTLAHELGHFFLHKDPSLKFRVDKCLENNSEEIEANYFAASFLVPKEKLLLILRETKNIPAIAQYFAVSEDVIKIIVKHLIFCDNYYIYSHS